jgi:nucleotide-binding universal stress UspA family protein
MPSFQQVLFPVDFSERNCLIAPHVISVARHYKAHVSMVHVFEMIPAGRNRGWPEYGLDIDIPALRKESEKRLSSFLTREFEGVSMSRVLLEGDPASRIARYVEDEKIDLIMMPTHGYGPFRRFLLGSVTAKVLHDVNCAVWTSAHTEEAPGPPTGYRNVICALDLSSNSLRVLRWASEFARERRATLKLVHAITAGKAPPGWGKYRQYLFEVAREELAKLQSESGTNFETVLEGGEVAVAVRKAAEQSRTDLVIIGRGVMQKAFGRMRTNVYSIIREAPCPVISI